MKKDNLESLGTLTLMHIMLALRTWWKSLTCNWHHLLGMARTNILWFSDAAYSKSAYVNCLIFLFIFSTFICHKCWEK